MPMLGLDQIMRDCDRSGMGGRFLPGRTEFEKLDPLRPDDGDPGARSECKGSAPGARELRGGEFRRSHLRGTRTGFGPADDHGVTGAAAAQGQARESAGPRRAGGGEQAGRGQAAVSEYAPDVKAGGIVCRRRLEPGNHRGTIGQRDEINPADGPPKVDGQGRAEVAAAVGGHFRLHTGDAVGGSEPGDGAGQN